MSGLLVLDVRLENDGRAVGAVFSVAKSVIGEFIFAGVIEPPEAALARLVLLSGETNEVAIQAEIMPNGILNETEPIAPSMHRTLACQPRLFDS